MKSVAVKLPEDLLARLHPVSRRAAGRSSVVRKALRRFLENVEETAAGTSFAEQAAGAAGCFKGPRHLSHSFRHMRDYGR
jgi:metal-responsive CopG/Arc/MetJ family transcriptional regulator